MTDRSSSSVSTTDAIAAMRQRGIDDPESLVSATTADRIVETCNHADKQGWAKNLLVWKIKQGGVDPSVSLPKVDKRSRFDQITAPFPESAVTESHKRLARRRDHQEDCDGMLVVLEEPRYPFLNVRCDGCGLEFSYPYRALAAGVLPDGPPIAPRPVPAPSSQVPESQHRPVQPHQVMARLSKHHALKGQSQGG